MAVLVALQIGTRLSNRNETMTWHGQTQTQTNQKIIQNKSNVPRCVNCANHEVTKQFHTKALAIFYNYP